MNLNRETQKIISREPITMRYYDEIRQFQPLDAENERRLLALAKAGDIAARDEIVKSQLKFVVTMARRAKTNLNINDVINEGNIGLIEAIDNYDMSSDVRFASYAVHWINKAITNFVVNNEKLVRMKNANRIYTYVNRFRNEFFNENQRYPTDDELREHAALNGVEFPKTQIFNTVIASIDTIDADYNDNATSELLKEAEMLSSSNNIDIVVNNDDNKVMVNNLLSVCTVEEREILSMFYGIGRKEESIASIAAIKNMKPAKVKNICKKAIEKIKIKNKIE